MPGDKIKVVIVTGPTATGKTALAVKLAKNFSGEIISADSRQVYRGLDLGTGKDLEEYYINGKQIKHYLIDIISPLDSYNLRQFNIDAKNKIERIQKNNKLPIIAGGTISYIDSLLSEYEFPLPPPNEELREKLKTKSTVELSTFIKQYYPEVYKKIDNTHSRPRLIRYYEKIVSEKDIFVNQKQPKKKKYEWLILGTYFERKKVHFRIEERLKKRLSEGMIEEVIGLHKNGVSWEKLDSFGLEYRYISSYLKNEIDYDTMFQSLLAKIRKLARSQDVWFRKLEGKGYNIYWIPEGDFEKASGFVKKFLKNEVLPGPKFQLKNIYYGPKSIKKQKYQGKNKNKT